MPLRFGAVLTPSNVSWLALRDRLIGWAPKALGVLVALGSVFPLDCMPGIHPLAVFVTASAIDLTMEFTYPKRDTLAPVIDEGVEIFLGLDAG